MRDTQREGYMKGAKKEREINESKDGKRVKWRKGQRNGGTEGVWRRRREERRNKTSNGRKMDGRRNGWTY